MSPPSRLLAKPPESVQPKKPKILIFGPPGVRKTWISCDFPQAYYIDTEGGADLQAYREKIRAGGGAYMGQEDGALDFDVITDQIQALSQERHPFRTLVIDSASKLWHNAIAEESEKLGDKDAFGASKKAPTRKFALMVRALNKLDMTCILIAHQKEQWGLNRQKQREMIGYTYDCQEKLEHELHLSLRIGLSASGRDSVAYVGKSRLPSFINGDNFDWDYPTFSSLYGRDVIEREAIPTALATDEQLKEIASLMEIIRVPEDWEGKVFKKEEVEAWAEMPSERIQVHINFLRTKLQVVPTGAAA